MAHHDADSSYWAAVTRQARGECVVYSPEELAAFAEGKLRQGPARTLQAHLAICHQCRGVVQELRAELGTTQTVYRVAPTRVLARGWRWALAPVALAAAALILVMVTARRPLQVTPSAPSPAGSPVVAQAPTAPPAPIVRPTTPTSPGARARTAVKPDVRRPPTGRHAGRPTGTVRRDRPAPEFVVPAPDAQPLVGPDQAIAATPVEINPMPTILSLTDEDAERIYAVDERVSPADHPELINDPGSQEVNLPPTSPAGAEAVFSGPHGDPGPASPEPAPATQPCEGWR